MKPSTHVIILAQGSQRRLPDLTIPKQLLALPACAQVDRDDPATPIPTTIIERTLCQIAMLSPAIVEDDTTYCDNVSVTVVCEGELFREIDLWGRSQVFNVTHRVLSVAPIALAAPGNSSLKGIDRFLKDQLYHEPPHHPNERVVVLLGDVIYSWEVLLECMVATNWGCTFVGTPDLSRSGGELWGLMWTERAREPMMQCLERALAKHPPFSEYQPGQMRRWLWAFDEFVGDGGLQRTWFRTSAPGDYTRDIDLPEHVLELGRISELAAADDARHGLRWKR